MNNVNILKKLLPYSLSFIIPFSAICGIELGGVWTFFAFSIAFIFLPILELFLGSDEKNLSELEEEKLKDNPLFSFLLWLQVIAQYAVLLVFLNRAGNFSTIEIVGSILSAGVMFGGIGITAAHELIHRKSKFEQFLGKALLLSTSYIHFYIEHIRGHHRKVGTAEDPASAKPGQSFYSFWIQTVIGSYLSSWKLEAEKLSKKRLPKFSIHNQMIRFTLITLLFWLSVIFIYGLSVFIYYLLASIIGFSLLELVNYIEHYGLVREKREDGRYEKVNALHSWNSNNYLSRRILFELTRHSDHHLNASHKYQILNNIEESPVLPTGYPGMIVLALFPPLWKKVMNKRLNKILQKEF